MQKEAQSTTNETQSEPFEVEQSSNEHQEKSAKLPPSQVGPTPSLDDTHTQQTIENDNDVDNNGMLTRRAMATGRRMPGFLQLIL